eukprot:scaffold537_cov180-Ochromonas_danica.AAC.12
MWPVLFSMMIALFSTTLHSYRAPPFTSLAGLSSRAGNRSLRVSLDSSSSLDLNGVFAVYKPQNLTSAQVANKLKWIVSKELKKLGVHHNIKLGHGGTLDPLAEGVLVIGVGKGTKLLDGYLKGNKQYIALAQTGSATDTLDSQGVVVSTAAVEHLTEDLLRQSLIPFRGEIDQIPPMYSALRKNGRKLYEYARKGEVVERAARRVTVYSLSELPAASLSHFFPSSSLQYDLPHYFGVEVECSGGFYVRTLIDDLGRHMGSAAHMIRLLRKKQGMFRLEDCLMLDFQRIDDEDHMKLLDSIRVSCQRSASMMRMVDDSSEPSDNAAAVNTTSSRNEFDVTV